MVSKGEVEFQYHPEAEVHLPHSRRLFLCFLCRRRVEDVFMLQQRFNFPPGEGCWPHRPCDTTDYKEKHILTSTSAQKYGCLKSFTAKKTFFYR